MFAASQLHKKGVESELALSSTDGRLARIAVKWEAVMDFLVPLGYEDDTGFHYGEIHVSSESRHISAR